MQLNNKNILIISPDSWGINRVSKHHYALELAKRGNNVYFLNPPTGNFNSRKEGENLFIINYKSVYKGLSKMPAFLSAFLIKKEVERLQNYCKTNFDIIWNFDSSSFFNLKLLYNKFRISHIVDLSEDRNIKLLNSTVDICFASSKFILQRQKKHTAKAHFIGHGIHHFNNAIQLNKPSVLAGELKVGYIGNLLIKYLEWELIFKLVKSNPKIDFYFAGPFTNSNLTKQRKQPPFLTKAMEQNNTHFIGSINPSEVGSFLNQMDILLLVYKAQDFKEQLANPHKLLEYLASGKVIIASWTDEYKDKPHLLEMVDDNSKFLNKFNTVVENISYYNNTKLQKLRKKYALENTYESKILEIEKLISNLGK